MGVLSGLKLVGSIMRRTKDEQFSRYILAERLTGLVYPSYKFSEFGRIYQDDHEFLDYYERFQGKSNYHSLDRKYTLDQLAKLTAHVCGDTAECGAYLGASSFLICRRTAGSGKRHHVFDSFEGLSQPRAEDGGYWAAGDLSVAEEAIRKNLSEFDFVEYYKGWIPNRFPEVADRRFSLVHIDVDLYQPTLDSLSFFFERMTSGGIVVCDDYGFTSCPGAKRAFDTYFDSRLEQVVSLPTGQAFVVKACLEDLR